MSATEEIKESVIKSVFCSYRGVLYVHDVHGEQIKHLCGDMTLEKYHEIERRSDSDITEFDGIDHYKRIASDLMAAEEQEEEQEEEQPQQGVFNPPTGTGPIQIQQQRQTATITVENTSKKKLPVVLFCATQNAIASLFGNVSGIIIDRPNSYSQILARTIQQPIMVKSITIDDFRKISSVIEIIKESPFGGSMINSLNISNFVAANSFNFNPNIANINTNFVLDGYTKLNFELNGNSKVRIELYF